MRYSKGLIPNISLSSSLHRSRLEVVLSEKALLVLIQVFEHGLKQSIEATEVTVMCHKKIADWDENGRMNRTWRAHWPNELTIDFLAELGDFQHYSEIVCITWATKGILDLWIRHDPLDSDTKFRAKS